MTDKIHIVCPACASVNGVPHDKDCSVAKCGKCKSELFPKSPVLCDSRNFLNYINRSHLPVVVDFWAPWCGPCKMMGPQFEQASLLMKGKVHFVKLDTEQSPDIGSMFNIRSIPTMALFKKGTEIARTSGAMQSAYINRWIEDNINKI
ncbi:MAG: thioredoxin TrxC [Deltaproteobacteria bacterium]|nr:thioredoxin TrxC [Deltaproteobacteria bacterium]